MNSELELATSGAAATAINPEGPRRQAQLSEPSSPHSTNTSDSTAPSSYWGYASHSFRNATETTYSGLASLVSSVIYQDNRDHLRTPNVPPVQSLPHLSPRISSTTDEADGFWSPRSRTRRSSAPDLNYLMENPYNSVRGRHSQRTSRSAVRSLLSLVPVFADRENDVSSLARTKSQLEPLPEHSEFGHDPSEVTDAGFFPSTDGLDHSWTDAARTNNRNNRSRQVSDSETASQLAEGTIRALRDLCLDEAGDLHASLRFWSLRWERPLLSWLEAGPYVWTSKSGYNHQSVGRRVSQIQAVLARRCSAIGELQEHLLKAGWQRGVAQWGVLGHGGQWAPVAGFDGTMANSEPNHDEEDKSSRGPSLPTIPPPEPMHRQLSSEIRDLCDPPPTSDSLRGAVNASSSVVMANVFVQKRDGGGIFVEDPSNLADWSVQAISLVRQQLLRAANGRLAMPYAENWVTDQYHDEEGPIMISEPDEYTRSDLPKWAIEIPLQMSSRDFTEDSGGETPRRRSCTSISNLPLMVNEVSELLNIMEDVMDIQRERRLERLEPPSWLRRNWYIVATAVPTSLLLVIEVVRKGQTKALIQSAIRSVSSFVKERLRDPVVAIVQELWKGRENFSDSKARAEATDVLKKMIESWLADNYPDMSDDARKKMAAAMDVSLVEKTKEESMKTFYEINNVIRMSFIEMQYMKKEMMNALGAMDEMMSANDINMNLAAITPVFLVSYVSTRVFRFLYYVFLKLGKSRAEVYASFRDVLTDIDRLLVMRDSPPLVLPDPSSAADTAASHALAGTTSNAGGGGVPATTCCLLGRDDLGMLMLLIHECRTIMWRAGPRRFPSHVVVSVSEDLAELAGERGPVSVRQQLHIVARMSRTYYFLRGALPTGQHDFRYSHLRGI